MRDKHLIEFSLVRNALVAIVFLFTLLNPVIATDAPRVIEIVDYELDKKLTAIESALRKGASDSFLSLSDLMESMFFTGVPEAKKLVASLAKQHNTFQSVFGDNVGVERIGGIKLGESLLSMVYVWKMKEAATIWYFNFYKNDKEWKLMSFASETMGAFLDRPDKLLSLGVSVKVSGNSAK